MVAELDSTRCNFVRCIKPNAQVLSYGLWVGYCWVAREPVAWYGREVVTESAVSRHPN